MPKKLIYIGICSVIILAAFTVAADAAKNFVEFRLVLHPNELHNKKFEDIKVGNEIIHVYKLYYLADIDVEKVEIFRSATKKKSFMAGFKFNKDGRKKLYRFTKRFAKRQVAIFIEGKLVTIPLVWAPYFMGDKVVVNWPGTEEELFAFAVKVNNQQPSIVMLYIEEQGNYNDIAADAWGATYERFNNYVEAKARQCKNEFLDSYPSGGE